MGGHHGFTFHWPVNISDMEIEFTARNIGNKLFLCTEHFGQPSNIMTFEIMVPKKFKANFDICNKKKLDSSQQTLYLACNVNISKFFF